jgi:hypothetical protein
MARFLGTAVVMQLALLSRAATVTSGDLTLTIDNNQLIAVETRGVVRKVVPGSGYTSVTESGSVTDETSVVMHGGLANSVCINRTVTTVAKQHVYISDCFSPDLAVTNTVEWVATISSDAVEPFSVPLHHGIAFYNLATDTEQVWSAWDAQEDDEDFLLATASAKALGNRSWWLGGLLSSGTYGFTGPMLSVPIACTMDTLSDTGVAFALHLDDFLSTKTCFNSSYYPNDAPAAGDAARTGATTPAAHGIGFEHHWHRLGGVSPTLVGVSPPPSGVSPTPTSPLVLRAHVGSIGADPRAALGVMAALHPRYFHPPVAAARTIVSGTGWYSKCGPGELTAPSGN